MAEKLMLGMNLIRYKYRKTVVIFFEYSYQVFTIVFVFRVNPRPAYPHEVDALLHGDLIEWVRPAVNVPIKNPFAFAISTDLDR